MNRGCSGWLGFTVLMRSIVSDSFVTTWMVAQQTSLYMGFPRQEHCSGLPFPSPGDLPKSGIELVSLTLAGRFFSTEPPRKPREDICIANKNMKLFSTILIIIQGFPTSLQTFSSVQFSCSVLSDSL